MARLDKEAYEGKRESCLDMAKKFNNDIEKYLANIDNEHGTNYRPSGATRIY